jgi:hypothetical protein
MGNFWIVDYVLAAMAVAVVSGAVVWALFNKFVSNAR